MVTPEMLLWLAERMGLERPYICTEAESKGKVAHGVGGYCIFNPATDDAQFGRLVVWAAMNMVSPMLDEDSVFTTRLDNHDTVEVPHNSTPDSIRAAAVVAICRALGWEDAK